MDDQQIHDGLRKRERPNPVSCPAPRDDSPRSAGAAGPPTSATEVRASCGRKQQIFSGTFGTGASCSSECSPHPNLPYVVTVYLHGPAAQWIDGVAARTISGAPGVVLVTQSLTSPTIQLVRLSSLGRDENAWISDALDAPTPN